jgi:hypothetical protein
MSYATARKWGQWGEKQLFRLKAFSGRIVNRVYEPVKDIVVHVESANGLDNVTVINTGGEVSCKFPVVPVCGARCSDFQLQCDPPGFPERDDRIGMLSRTPNDDDWSQYIWDYGEGGGIDFGNWTTHHQVQNIYQDPGEYTISLTVKKFERVSEYHITPTVVPGGTLYRFGQATTQAAAYTAFLAAPWVVTPGYEGADPWYKVTGQKGFGGSPTYTYTALKVAYQVDLSGVDPADITSATLRVPYGYWFDSPPPTTPVHPGTEIESSIGGAIVPAENEHQIDVMSLIGSSFQVEYRDEDEDYDPLPALPDPLPSASIIYARGWFGGTPLDIDFEYVPGGWTILKTTKTIKVNVGSPKKTRQVGESIHEDLSP